MHAAAEHQQHIVAWMDDQGYGRRDPYDLSESDDDDEDDDDDDERTT
jgi:hypothetical protein